MTEQLPTENDLELGGGEPVAGPTGPAGRATEREWMFNREVHEHAIRHGWRPFHVDRFRVVRGRGFPDLAMFRQDPDTGNFEMLVAELKRDAVSEFLEGQEDWLEAFNQMGIVTKVWRGDNPDHRDEMYDIIENGTSGHTSVVKLPPTSTNSPIPANFGVVIANTIESIESPEFTTGESASLRRMDPINPNSPAFWKLMSQRGMPEKAGVEKWALIMHGIALMAHGTGNGIAHRPRMPVGRTLYVGGEQQAGERGFYSEDRLATLLAARGTTLRRLLARLFRLLANEGCSFNWSEMAWFILNEGYNEEQAEQSRIRIARAYYRAERRGSQSSAE
ncbi:MAG: type I-E CRISPR-associated protein Cse2/CasB [Dehalococcoidia bacterium]|nr:type I-E CRISPR-associated protein Cse2/CasB [Dehalococcoidia bacterium]